MVCTWCEEDNELIALCNFDNHNVCKMCYEKYLETYPMRMEGCPYCNGNQEKVIVHIDTPDDVTDDVDDVPDEPETIFTVPHHSAEQELTCDNGIISVIIISSTCMIFILFFISRTFITL